MGENIEALVWRANEADVNGDVFTADALRGMADGLIPGSEISFNFDFQRVVGYVVQPWIDGDDLYMYATFDDPEILEALRDGKAAIRPGFSIEAEHQEDCGRVIDAVGVVHVAVTPNPMPLPGDQSGERFPDGCVGEHKAGTCSTWEA